MNNKNKKRSMKIMAGVLAASIIIGNGHWLASAEEVGQAPAEQNGEIVAAASTATVESAPPVVKETPPASETAPPAETTPPDNGDGSLAGDGSEGGSSEESGGDENSEGNSDGNGEENSSDGGELNPGDEQGNEDDNGNENNEGDGSENQPSDGGEEQPDKNVDETGNTNQGNDNKQNNDGSSDGQKNNNNRNKQSDAILEANNPAVERDANWSGDSVPGWANSEQEYIKGNLEVAEQIRLLEAELSNRVNRALESYHLKEDAVSYEDSNFIDIFAIYAVKYDMTDNFPYEVEFADKEAREELIGLFNQMTRVNKVDSDHLTVRRLTYDEVSEELEFDEVQKAAAAGLVNDESRTLLQEMYDDSILSTLTDEEFAAIEEAVSIDVSGARRSVLLAALSLEGKIGYFWGGKSYHIGWDQRWGQQGLVTAEGSSSSGTVQKYGMDCSGFVSWAFINGGGDQSVLAYIGNGTANQFSNSYAISWEEAMPGDLLFYKTPNAGGINHIGIVVSNGPEGIKVVHCAGGTGVVVTGKAGFQHVRRPYVYSENQ